MQLGNTYFEPSHFKDWTKEQFIQCYRGKLDGIDIETAYNLIQKENSKNEVKTEETKKPRKSK